MKTGIAVFAHGSSVEAANDVVRVAAGAMAQTGGFDLVETAFLDPVKPGLTEAVTRLVDRGARRVVVIPYFLTPGLHLERDLPHLVSQIRALHPDVAIAVTPPLDGHPGLSQILIDRAREAVRTWR